MFNDAYRFLTLFIIVGRNKIKVFEASEVDKRGFLNLVFHVGFDERSVTSARRDPRQRNWQRAGERKAVGVQGRTDEPYLGWAALSSPSTPACRGALAARLFLFGLDNTCTQEKHTHTFSKKKKEKRKKPFSDVHKHRYALLLLVSSWMFCQASAATGTLGTLLVFF